MAKNDTNDEKKKKKHEGEMTVREAGERGGKATSETHGHEFYSNIGHKGGEKGGPRVRDLIEKGKEREAEEE